MTASKRSQSCFAGLVLIALAPSLARAQTAVGSGPQMTGQFGPAKARTKITAGKSADDYVVSLNRRGACNGMFAGPARAYSSNLVTMSEREPANGATCTVDIT